MKFQPTSNVRNAAEQYLRPGRRGFYWCEKSGKLWKRPDIQDAEVGARVCCDGDHYTFTSTFMGSGPGNRVVVTLDHLTSVLRECTAVYSMKDDMFVDIAEFQSVVLPEGNWRNEHIITLNNGATVRFDTQDGATQLRVVNSAGREIHRWSADLLTDTDRSLRGYMD